MNSLASAGAASLGAGAGAAGALDAAAAGAGASPGFSPDPSASSRATLLAASAASGPRASTRSLSPNFVASPMSATTDLAFALASPRSKRISDLNFFASTATTAAGRACRPAGFGSVISPERIAPVALAVSLFSTLPISSTYSATSVPATTSPFAGT
ncbi:hypothetical protein OKW48_007456 [Paraburkholderia youngii]